MSDFVHLHAHTEYSLLDGTSKIQDVTKHLKERGMDAHAITDHGTMAGIPEFYWTLRKEGIVPILGAELYIDEGLENRYPAHLTVLVASEDGYRQLIELNNMAQAQFYDRPRLTYAQVFEYAPSGLIALSGCMSSRGNRYAMAGQKEAAVALYNGCRSSFKDFYFEVQLHDLVAGEEVFHQEEKDLANISMAMAKEIGAKCVFTNDTHYTSKDHEETFRRLRALAKESGGKDYQGLEFSGTGFYIKSPEEIAARIPAGLRGDLMANTLEIAHAIGEVRIPELDKSSWHMPFVVEKPLEVLASKAAKKGRLKGRSEEYKVRWEHELSVIEQANFASIYLTTLDYVEWAKENGIKVGPGRGSMTGSLVSFAVGITDIDPIEHDLLFERAINPARPSIPDFDIDFQGSKRKGVFDYIESKYGANQIHIGTVGKYTLKGSLRSVLRAFGMPFLEQNALIKELDTKETFEEIDHLFENDEIKALLLEYPDLKKMIEYKTNIAFSNGTHAAGVVISDDKRPLRFELPLVRLGEESTSSAYDMDVLKKMGFVKFDILGTSVLDIIDECEKTTGVNIDFSTMKFDDPKVFETINLGYYGKLFQIEGVGSIQVIKAMGGIKEFEDIVAMNALGRPGAIQFLSRFCEWRKDHSKIRYPDHALANILDKTHGVILYQEQVMQIAKELAGFDDVLVDDIKEAIKYFRDEVFAELEPRFLAGCIENDIAAADAKEIFSMIKDFAGYGFNRAHAVAYSAIGYVTAWFKTYYPAEFYAAALNHTDPDEYKKLILEVRKMKLSVFPPDVNESVAGFSVKNGGILFGISSIAFCSEITANEIVTHRPFESVEDLISKVQKSKCNVRSRTNLEAVGAFRFLPDSTPLTVKERRLLQHKLIGVRIEYSDEEIELFNSNDPENGVRTGVVLSEKRIVTKKGDAMGFLKVEDGGPDITLFPAVWISYRHLEGRVGNIIRVFGRLDTSGNRASSFLADHIEVYK